MMDKNSWYFIGLLYFACSMAVTLFVLKRDDLTTFQKCAQSALVWLFPFLGAIVFWSINRSHDVVYKQTNQNVTAVDSGGFDASEASSLNHVGFDGGGGGDCGGGGD